uniref:Uncharacterized protein n=1 Tax=Rhizophora mucronata TaxID=61149 RepID=A0A2P2NL02_RHIMU
MLLFCNSTWRRFVRFPITPDRVPERDWLGAPRPITRFSGEQVIIAQLQGSTESPSQLFKTPCGSSNASFTLIKASTSWLRGSYEEERVARQRQIIERTNR